MMFGAHPDGAHNHLRVSTCQVALITGISPSASLPTAMGFLLPVSLYMLSAGGSEGYRLNVDVIPIIKRYRR